MQDCVIRSIFLIGYFRNGREHSSRKKNQPQSLTALWFDFSCPFPSFSANIIKFLPKAFRRHDFSYHNGECFSFCLILFLTWTTRLSGFLNTSISLINFNECFIIYSHSHAFQHIFFTNSNFGNWDNFFFYQGFCSESVRCLTVTFYLSR